MPLESARERRHVFISYVRQDADAAGKLATALEEAGVEVWRDRDRIVPGARWQHVIRKAIRDGAFFIACFSESSVARERSYMNEELVVAIEELRKRPINRSWFLPVLLDPGALPERDIGAGETLADLQYVPLYEDWEDGVRRLVSVIEPEAYEPPHVRARRERFRRPSAATPRGSTFVESLLGAPLHDLADMADEIIRALKAGAALPTRFVYSTDAGAHDWLQLCADLNNRSYREALKFWSGSGGTEVADFVRHQFAREDFDHLSLGCGDGRKDASLVSDWLRHGARITYYPYDINALLLRIAVNCVLDRAPLSARRRFQTKAIMADFDQLEVVGGLLQQQPGPTVVTLLGDSFGSMELAFLRNLKRVMTSDDLLVLEVPLAEEGSPGFESPIGLSEARFWFRPLEVLGLPFDPGRMKFTLRRDMSAVRNTATRVISYSDFELGVVHYSQVVLAKIHYYSEPDFHRAVAGAGFEILERRMGERPNGFVVCVARPSTSGAG